MRRKATYLTLLCDRGGLPWFKASRIFADIVNGVHFIHSKGLCHRDIKPENILIRANMSAAITDFGFATWSSKGLTEPCGSLPFAAPELLVGKNIIYDGQASDMWSLGCGVVHDDHRQSSVDVCSFEMSVLRPVCSRRA